MEDIFKTHGIIPEDNEITIDVKKFNMQGYTDNINFCETKKVFLELSNYLKQFVNNNLTDNTIKHYEYSPSTPSAASTPSAPSTPSTTITMSI